MQATFRSAQTSTPSVFHVISDESTVESLISSIDANCSAVLGPGSSMSPTAFDGGPSVRFRERQNASQGPNASTRSLDT